METKSPKIRNELYSLLGLPSTVSWGWKMAHVVSNVIIIPEQKTNPSKRS